MHTYSQRDVVQLTADKLKLNTKNGQEPKEEIGWKKVTKKRKMEKK